MNKRLIKSKSLISIMVVMSIVFFFAKLATAGELNGTFWSLLVPSIQGGQEDFDDPWPMSFQQVGHKGSEITAIYEFGKMMVPVGGTISKIKKGYTFSISPPGSRVVFTGKLIPVSGEEYSSESNYEQKVMDAVTAAGGKVLWKITDGVMHIKHSDVNIFSDRPKGKGSYKFIGHVFKPKTATFTTGALTVTDIDGNIYNTVTIGTQVWLKENLKVTKYSNGDAIPTTTTATLDIFSGKTSPKYQWAYDGNKSNVATYGRLYTWHAVTDSRGVCPTGWHVPTNAEWTTLTDYLGDESVVGGKMKEAGTIHWDSPNTGADNSSGWTALPGGYRDGNGTFYSIGNYGRWWSATEVSAAIAWGRTVVHDGTYAVRDSASNINGFSVRCVRD